MAPKNSFVSRKWAIAAAILLVVIAGGVVSFFSFIRDARTGDDPAVTYRAYHMHLLGDVAFAGCEVGMAKPWFPKLASYETLSEPDRELVFVDTGSPVTNGKALSVSFVHNLPELRSDALLEPAKLGEITAQFVKAELNLFPNRAFAWLPDYKFYAAAQSEQKLREGLAVVRISCQQLEKKVPISK